MTAAPSDTPQAPTPPTPKRSNKALIISITALLGALLLLGLGVVGGIYAQRAFFNQPSTYLEAGDDGNASLTEEETTVATVAEKVSPSVVSVITQSQARSYYGTVNQSGAGTGIIVSKDGYVMTNNHVIEGASSVSLVDSEGKLYEDVTVIGRDPLNDIAFLKISADKEFKPATLGNSSTLRIGQRVVAIGNALGQFSNTVTSGIVSGTGRPITANSANGTTESLTDLIQTDASINPGNSGGPLVNMAGQVIGINTAIVEDANGIGFAIPINATKGVLSEVLDKGEANRAYLGVNYLSVTPDIAREYDLPVQNGAYIYSSSSNPVATDSPAAKAGLRAEDIILKINDNTIGAQGSLSSIIGQYRPGDKVSVTYLRDGKERTTDITYSTYQ